LAEGFGLRGPLGRALHDLRSEGLAGLCQKKPLKSLQAVGDVVWLAGRIMALDARTILLRGIGPAGSAMAVCRSFPGIRAQQQQTIEAPSKLWIIGRS
jgi:NaMN:DMB phosphoribosyltransferase